MAEFVRQAWKVVEPETKLLWNWHLDYLCEYLELVTYGYLYGETATYGPHAGELVRKLLINEPPRYMKSMIVSIMWPCWEWVIAPQVRFLCSSYADVLATDHSLARRRILESEWYTTGMHKHWGQPRFGLSADMNVKTAYENDSRGTMLATSFSGSAIGRGGDRVIVDDPQDPQKAYSEAERMSTLRHWDQGLSTRLNDKKRGAYVIVMQRLHQADLTGHVLDEPDWIHVCIPGIAEQDEEIVLPRSGVKILRKEGELLWPEREGEAEITTVRTRLGTYGFAGQYQQRPTALEGGMIKRDHIRFWVTQLQPDDDPDRVVVLPRSQLVGYRQSWDFGLWGERKDDFSVGQVWAKLGANRYLLDQSRSKVDPSGAMGALRALTQAWPQALRKVIETAGAGPDVIRKLRNEIPGMIPHAPRGDKEARMMAVQPMFEAGNVFVPHPREAGWVSDWIEELITFPFVDNDDQADATSQALMDFDKDDAGGTPSHGGERRFSSTPSVGNSRRVQAR